MRSAHPDDLEALLPSDEDAEPSEQPTPFEFDDYYADAFCSLLDGGMGTCCS